MATGTETPSATRLREYLAPLEDLSGVLHLLSFDQETIMPAGGHAARGLQQATITGLIHERLTAPELMELIAEAEASDPEGDDAAIVREARRDAEKAARVPADLVKELTLAANAGQEAWVKAREGDDFASFLPFLERNVELRRRYADCFDVAEPYDALLDDFEPGMRAADIREVFGPLRDEMPGLVAAAAERSAPPLEGPFPIDAQRRAVDLLLERVGFDGRSWLLGISAHPFSATPGRGDNRITTRFGEESLESWLSCLHEFGHGLYEAQTDAALARTPLGHGVSMAVHESQSRLWEIFVGMSLPFWRGVWPELCDAYGGAPGGLAVEDFVARLNRVAPTLIRVDSDPVSYPLHIVLRFDLELALVSGDLAARDLPGAWRDGMRELLGIEVPNDRLGVLQDMHWSFGAFGYFPTYALGTILAAQIWDVARGDLPGLDDQLEAGDFAPLRGWLAEKVHRHGKRLEPRDLIRSAAGRDLDAGPYLAFARGRAGR
ncbi:MAG: Carboxypeptidase Taq [Solirubrobacterales bacterium]|nr:Carboxypeptidase Taq [Solirubrobacterales bacterium]